MSYVSTAKDDQHGRTAILDSVRQDHRENHVQKTPVVSRQRDRVVPCGETTPAAADRLVTIRPRNKHR